MNEYSITYNTIRNIYSQISKTEIPVYMIGGISAAIQTGRKLYRKNSDLDLMVDKQNLPVLLAILNKLGYQIDDKRGILTDNYIDEQGDFHTCCHDINANINSSEMLGVSIFVYEKTDGNIIRSTYNYDQRTSTFTENRSVIPTELFDLTYDSNEISYGGTNVRCQTKEATFLSKSKGTRDKDKIDASILRDYIGPKEIEKIRRIRKLEKRIQQYIITYDKNANIISSEKLPSFEEKIERFIMKFAIQNPDKTDEELKNIIFKNEQVRKNMEQDDDLRNIITLWQTTQSEGNIAKHAAKIAHSYIYDEEITCKKLLELKEDEIELE